MELVDKLCEELQNIDAWEEGFEEFGRKTVVSMTHKVMNIKLLFGAVLQIGGDMYYCPTEWLNEREQQQVAEAFGERLAKIRQVQEAARRKYIAAERQRVIDAFKLKGN